MSRPLLAAVLAACIPGCLAFDNCTECCDAVVTGEKLQPPAWIQGTWQAASGSTSWTFESGDVKSTEVSRVAQNFSDQRTSTCRYELTLNVTDSFNFMKKSATTLEYSAVSVGGKYRTSLILTRSGANAD